MTSELRSQLLALSPSQKAEALQVLTQTLNPGSRGISKTPDVCGGDACIAGTRVPIWVLVDLRQQGANDAKLLEFYPSLTAADLVNAWAYAEANLEEIEMALREEIEDCTPSQSLL